MTILTEANELITGPRAEAYGPADRNLGRIAEQWTLYLLQKYGVNLCLDAEDVCWMQVDLKKCRQMNTRQRDNVRDAAGYLGLIELAVKDEPEAVFESDLSLCQDCDKPMQIVGLNGVQRCGNMQCNMFMRKQGHG